MFALWLAATFAGEELVYVDDMPTSLDPVYAATEADHRTHQLLFDRLYYHSGVS